MSQSSLGNILNTLPERDAEPASNEQHNQQSATNNQRHFRRRQSSERCQQHPADHDRINNNLRPRRDGVRSAHDLAELR